MVNTLGNSNLILNYLFEKSHCWLPALNMDVVIYFLIYKFMSCI